VPWCGIQIVDLRTGDIVQWIRLDGYIKELFDVGVIAGAQCPMALGIGTPEVQHTISFETEFAPITLDPPPPPATQPKQEQPAAKETQAVEEPAA
jgi:hypothetical protein